MISAATSKKEKTLHENQFTHPQGSVDKTRFNMNELKKMKEI